MREPLSRSVIRRVTAQQGQFGRELWRAVAAEAEERRCPASSRILLGRGLDCTLSSGHDGEHIASDRLSGWRAWRDGR